MLAVLQFDSTSVPLVERMLAEGRLATLAGIRERGRSYELDPGSTPLFPSAAYPTLYSGVEIPDHGIYSAFPWFPWSSGCGSCARSVCREPSGSACRRAGVRL